MSKSITDVIAQYSTSAKNVAVLFSNANDCKGGGSLTFAANVAANAAAALIENAQTLQNAGFLAIVATGTSGAYGTGDAGKDQCNPILRQAALAAGVPLWDIASDPRVGADGANTAGSIACNGGPVYQPDRTHPTACYQAYMGANLSVLVNRLLFAAPATVTTRDYSMSGTEQPLTLNPTGGAQTVTLVDCVGLTGQSFTFTNAQTSGTNTVVVQPASINQLIDGSASLQVSGGQTVRLAVMNQGDVSAGCSWHQQ